MQTENPSYAVVFKAHYWDEFVERQFARVRACAGTSHVFALVDETRRPLTNIRYDKVVRMTEATSRAEGYAVLPETNLFWYNTDYPLYHFIELHPHYDYVVVVEFDVYVNFDLRGMVQTMARNGLALVAKRLDNAEFHWRVTARPYYPPEIEITGRLLCLSAYSRPFVKVMQEARRGLMGRLVYDPERKWPIWPFAEAFVGAEIEQLGWPEAELTDFADGSRYHWAPARPEFALRDSQAPLVAHPVLGDDAFLAALAKVNWNPEDLFEPGSALRAWMQPLEGAEVVALFLRRFAADEEQLVKLRRYAEERGLTSDSIWNVARGKRATQSSLSQWSRQPNLAYDAAGAVDGARTENFGFHTALEPGPWWCVDLETAAPVRVVRLRHFRDFAWRARGLAILGSNDVIAWRELWRDDGAAPVGEEWRIELPEPVRVRFVRISLPGEQHLHLDQVEVLV